MGSQSFQLSREVLEQAARFALRARCYEALAHDPPGAKQGLVMPRRPGEDSGWSDEAKYDARETKNLLGLMGRIARDPTQPVTPEVLCGYHAELLARTEPPPQEPVGGFREGNVRMGQSFGAAPGEAPGMVEALLAWGQNGADEPLPQLPMASALIKAIVVHTELLEIHPFAEGNGRVARAAEFALLLRAGVPASLAHELQNHYNEDRSLYVHELRETERGDREAFLRYALQGLNNRLMRRVERGPTLARRQLLRAGFTLVELVVVILILGILAGVAAPKLLNTTATAQEAVEREVVNRIQDGIELFYLERLSEGKPTFPTELDAAGDSATCNASTPCFDKILKRGIRDGKWRKMGTYEYMAPSGTTYEYDPSSGEFLES